MRFISLGGLWYETFVKRRILEAADLDMKLLVIYVNCTMI